MRSGSGTGQQGRSRAYGCVADGRAAPPASAARSWLLATGLGWGERMRTNGVLAAHRSLVARSRRPGEPDSQTPAAERPGPVPEPLRTLEPGRTRHPDEPVEPELTIEPPERPGVTLEPDGQRVEQPAADDDDHAAHEGRRGNPQERGDDRAASAARSSARRERTPVR